VLGTPFYLMECVEGRIFRDPRLSEVPSEQRSAYFSAMVEVLGAIHRFDWEGHGLHGYGQAGK
jgi:aminoglycoside phosphotransferase (APT) family kinase protein